MKNNDIKLRYMIMDELNKFRRTGKSDWITNRDGRLVFCELHHSGDDGNSFTLHEFVDLGADVRVIDSVYCNF